MKNLQIIFSVAVLVLAASSIAWGQPPLYWGIHLWQDKEDGVISYEFDAYASFSGTVTTPLPETLPLGNYYEPTLPALEARFPDGTYTFDDGVGGTYYAELSGPFPGEFPNITFYAFNLAGDLVINWDPWTLGKSNPVIGVMTEHAEYYVELDPGATGHTIPAVEIPTNNPFSVMVQFKNWTGVGGSTHGDKIKSTTVHMFSEWGPPVSGLIWMGGEGSGIGYSFNESNWLYFYSSVPVLDYNITLGQWDPVGPVGLIYTDWPFYYVFETNCWMLAIPPASGLWVYHFSTGQWTILPRIIPW